MKAGDLVEYEEETCRVLRRRRVTAFAMFQTCEYEVRLETLHGEQVGWVAENEVTKVGGDPADG